MPSRPRGAPPLRRLLVRLLALVVVSSALALTGPQAGAAPAADPTAKIQPKLAQQLESKGEASFWVRFEQADLTAAAQLEDRTERGQAVYDALTTAAESRQKEARALLDSAGATYQSYWASNAIRVDAGDASLAESVASADQVVALYPTREYTVEEPTKGDQQKQVNAVEWGIANINADDVWNEYGVQGEGMVIANIDTGVQFDHPALVDQYRGNNGDGTFSHDYNWFDAAGSCATAPCDTNGHGTHTMGTMLGGDGGANQIGVAPGATWIAANGCCPSDAALIASGEWMLAPTDLAGDNPDVSKRPHIVNNSWGTTVPTNDPFMEDVQLAWAASGIWGQWSNGNSGPACQTSGSPGSRIINYSAGAYDVNNAIASFSARGAGQDGETKPNISAPGVNVRSAVPGSSYASYNGTSMASPHVAGAVALLWSAAPALAGDIEGTWDLLDGTAIDSANATCGGTADDNNVFGEGRLDALALVGAAPVGDTGTVAGTVTDEETGAPLDGATIDFEGALSRSVTTEDDGTYSVRLSAGDYTATVSMFGYVTETTEVTVTADQTTTSDHALVAAPSVTLNGTVTDGSGHEWPLYAKVDVGGPADDTWTDPETGEYSVTVPSNATYDVTITADYPGYTASTESVAIGDGDTTHDAALTVDTATCNAPGYEFNVAGVTEGFDELALPEGWTVEDNLGNGQVWTFDDPGGRGNLTGGAGGFAIMDSDEWGSGGQQDTSLVTPVVDMSDLTAPVVGFKQDYNNLGDTADVEVSIDGGETWETVLSQTTDVRGPREDVVQLPMAAGQSEVQLRFHHYDASYDWWWEVDDVFLGNRTCDPIPGGLVLGNVRSTASGDGINGATVTSLDAPETTATTRATPADENLDDGYYWMFSDLTGRHPFEASANQYESETATVRVIADLTNPQDFELGSGNIVVEPTELSGTRQLGGNPIRKTFEVTNTGSRAAEVELVERAGGFTMLGADGSRTSAKRIAAADGAPLQEIKADVSFSRSGSNKMATGDVPAAGPHADPWTDIADYPSVVMDNRVVQVDGVAYSIAGGNGSASSAAVHAYDPATLAWEPRASLPAARNAVAAGAVEGQVVVTGGWAASAPSPSTWVYDPASDAWSAGADAPVALSASGQAVAGGKLYTVGGCTTSACTPMSAAVSAYDPASDSWETLAPYPAAVAFASCGGIDDKVYCTGGNGGANGTADSYVYDTGADTWTAIPDAPADSWASGYAVANGQLVVNGGVQGGVVTNRTFAYDPAGEAWVDMPNSNTARYRGGMACGISKVGGSSGGFTPTVDSEVLPGFDDCGSSAADVEWLTVAPTTATLAPGESMTVRVTMDPAVAQPGTYTAGIGILEDTPGTVEPVSVTMTVTPPRAWGKLEGTVSGRSCAGATAPIPGATVQVDSWAGSLTFETESDGSYASWFNSKANPLQLIAAKDGYQPQFRQVRLTRGATERADFNLRKTGC
ncbi:peptidase S8 [Nocardioides euryhalodurans]|uniref:Peptidase S8 n=2 Tax=Nocardioides euryhalodurans TaxID=2518370 RepID=A0A4P7GR36_9ACTN|nr:peptidase S8 [Nocardioides euryhalodurans]